MIAKTTVLRLYITNPQLRVCVNVNDKFNIFGIECACLVRLVRNCVDDYNVLRTLYDCSFTHYYNTFVQIRG